MRFLTVYKLFCLLCVLFFTASCQAKETRTYPLAIHAMHGVQVFRVELADTDEETAMGLMHRRQLASDSGMLFVFPETKEVTFWMRNTLIPLDMIFIKEDGKIAHIHKMAVPGDETPISSRAPVKHVLEIPGGEADKRMIRIGDHVETDLMDKNSDASR